MNLLQERAKTHGDYRMTAQTAQKLKLLVERSPMYGVMNSVQRESLDMIMVKLARIMCGDPHEPDHWLDISGYAQLAMKERTEA